MSHTAKVPYFSVHRAAGELAPQHKGGQIWHSEFEKHFNCKFIVEPSYGNAYTLEFATEQDAMMFLLRWA
jgi:hypothetical protein